MAATPQQLPSRQSGSTMLGRLRPYAITLGAVAVLALSLSVMALSVAGIYLTDALGRALIIPGYVTMLLSAFLATALSIPNGPVLWLVAVAFTVLPFAALDWLRARRHRPDSPAA